MENQSSILNNRYKLLQRAGSGGMSTVYKGQDLMLGRIVAIKILHQGLTNDVEFLNQFQQEAHAAANLAHPNIVTVHDIGQDDRRYYIVMEYIEGWTLKDLIRQKVEKTGKPLSIDVALDLVIQICSGIGYAHRAGLVHCDVKSQNMLVTRDSRLKVTDFGIARALSEASLHGLDVVWGTPQYFSPEQAAGESATPASDVYSIGVILFEMLTGRLPFQAESHTALALMHINDPAPLVSQFNPAVAPQIERIIDKVLSKEPGGRYRTADQLGRVLTSYRETSLQDTGPIAATARTRSAQRTLEPTRLSEHDWLVTEPADTVKSSVDLHFSTMEQESGTDWTVIALGILAIISLIGLIPLWYLVYMRLTG